MSDPPSTDHGLTERLKLTVAYDGTPFRGWQSQASGDSVQDHLERSFQIILGTDLRVHGAGRTDAGVHATGQVAHVDVPSGYLTPTRWARALNDILHPSIRLVDITLASPDFHTRHHARGKIYRYRIYNASFLHPLEINRAWMVPGALDLARLDSAARLLEGQHDFAFLSAHRRQEEESTVRTIHEIRLEQEGPLLTLSFCGNGFLYHMVRILTGSLIRVARGRADEQWLLDLLALRTPEKSRYCAPAEGLYLTQVLY